MRLRSPAAAVWAMAAVYAAVFSYLSVQRHRSFWTGRFDLGNMVQAVWSTAQGRPLETTDVAGRQFVRLGAHVDPILVLFAPLTWTGHLPEAMLIAQAVIVATGAIPAYHLGRRWLGDARLGVAAAAVYLLYPPLQWATVAEFHPVTLAAPLLLFCIWFAQERRWLWLAVFAVAAALTKEQVGLALAVLGLWLFVSGARRAGAVLAGASLAWVALCMTVIIPHFNRGEPSEFIGRYSHLGDGPAGVVGTVLTRPWVVVETVAEPGRLAYLAALLAPLLFLPLAAPLLAAAALPELGLNLLAEWYPQYSFRYHYVAVIVPFFVAASLLGLARLRPRLERFAPGSLRGPMAAWVVWVALAGVVLGPLPWWSHVPLGSDDRAAQYAPDAHARTLARAVALIPDGEAVSAGNLIGAHVSARRRILFFPQIDDARWVIVDRLRPFVFGAIAPNVHEARVAALRDDPRFEIVFEEDGVIVARRRGGEGT
ncbi:MAG: DUF2079 domain-containing protein [Thermoleophilia bacterium]